MPITRSTGRGRIETKQSPPSETTATTQSVWTETTANTVMSLVAPTAESLCATANMEATMKVAEKPGNSKTEAVKQYIAKQNDVPTKQRAGTVKTDRSRNRKEQKIAKAREELARLQVELAAARLATLEAGSDDENSESEYSKSELDERVGTWLETQPTKTENDDQHNEKPAGTCDKQDFSDLTAAITLAVKAAREPRYTELPFFNGNHQDWLSFRAAYHETMNSFTKTENINRLRRNLKGRAKEAVDGLLITNADPSDVIRSLEARFGRPETIAITELDTLRALPRLTETPRDICIFSSKVTNAVATLRALNCTHYLYNPETTKTMLEKLTPTLRYRYYDFTAVQPKEDPDLIKFEKFMKREAELCSPYAQPEQAGHYSQPAQHNRRTQNVHIVSEKPSRAKCPVCSNTEHTTTGCYIFKKADSNTRWDIAKNKHLCFRCLQYKNKTHNCKPNTCGINDCKYTHNKMLHFDRKIEKTDKSNKETTENINSAWTGKQKQSYLKIIPVQVQGPIGTVDTYALLDDGSTVTLIDEIIRKKTGITGSIDPLHIQAINNIKSTETRSRRVNLTLRSLNSRKEIIQARTVNDLQVTAQKIPKEQIDEYSHLRDISDIITYENAKPGILIGQDNWHMLLASKVRRGNRNQPIASRTPLGWVLHGGRTRTLGHHINYINHASENQEDDKIENLVKQCFAMDALCITPRRPKTDPEEQALRILNSNTVHTTDGRYETALLWKTDNVSLPDNYNNSLKRLINIENKLDRNSELKQKYTEQMEALVAKGYAEPAPKTKTENRTWYLPHFAVVNPLKPEKLRVVHDAAARTRGVALNDMLLKGPDLLQSLPGVIMRFRQHNITVIADIKEMFIQVKLRHEDRDALRYLWCKDQRDDKPPEENRMTSLIFGASSSLSTAISVKSLNAQQHVATHPEAAAAIQNKHYEDDFLDSFKGLKDAVRITTDVRRIHEKAHFELKQWKSNSPSLLETLGENENGNQVELYKPEEKTERVLGLIWKTEKDVLTFDLNLTRIPPPLVEGKKPTKREALKVVMSLFDPLGFVSPVTNRAKQLLQEVWRRGTSWDDEIDNDLSTHWQAWVKQLRNLHNIAIPRCYLNYSDTTTLQLHVFTDASESAYAAALYWRTISPNNRIDVSLIMSKAKVAPLKLTSIPRLELQAATLEARLAEAVIAEHDRKPDSKTFWTDSKTVLTWIRTGSRSYKPYVAHRLAAIEDSSTVNEWRWVPTKHNLADNVTRDVLMPYQYEHRWFRGTEFLRQREDSWPTESASETTEPMGEVNIAAAAPAGASWPRRRHEKWKCQSRNTRMRGRSDSNVSWSGQRDNVRRIVDIRTKGGVLRRPVRKLLILPIEEDHPAPRRMRRTRTAGVMCRTK
ncbi:uncharacterized protein LOC119630005 [Bombyx mori]|uniref:Uncharacterized protein n=1 Tax=Bombyx mori TaxID=7091 RepID=A0A8R2M545_BOMMO|nr:uncharacterized protein LOC119630005 [Bombyx mori]